MPDTFLFVDHRVHDDPEDEFADIESAPLQSPDLVTVVIAGGAIRQCWPETGPHARTRRERSATTANPCSTQRSLPSR